ncbi:polyprenyl synthetase family protein [Umezawaea sp. NPDC059074]|uniref:polyprenyl synthetase family protein n=1 Tax=Umezawaea sp. NPDC059074 TaxID=3346716 RepID=UPI00369F9FE5
MSTTTAPTLGLTIPALAHALPRVEAEIHRMATSSSLPIVNEFSGRITAAGGKRLRSVLILASTVAMAGDVTDRAVTSAACVELLHAGSLVHDDLMDDAAERRGVPTVNAAWGPGPAVLVGDFMLARASQVALRDISPFAAERLAEAVADLVEGQVMEVLDLHDPNRAPESALRSIALKTGALFRVGCVLAAHCADADEATTARMAEYGASFGLLFQILDDLLDLASTRLRLGKPVGNDLRQGVYTFPLLRVMTPDLKALLAGDPDEVLAAVRRGPMVEDTLAYCRDLARRTAAALPELPASESADVLRALPSAYLNWASALIA